MNSISSISLSGMNAAQTSMSASAFNIANPGIDGSRREQVQQSTVSPAGITANVGHAVRTGDDSVTDMVGMLQAKNAFLANLAVFKTGAGMTGTLLATLG
jgi:flagellar basal body rod protein FlgC